MYWPEETRLDLSDFYEDVDQARGHSWPDLLINHKTNSRIFLNPTPSRLLTEYEAEPTRADNEADFYLFLFPHWHTALAVTWLGPAAASSAQETLEHVTETSNFLHDK